MSFAPIGKQPNNSSKEDQSEVDPIIEITESVLAEIFGEEEALYAKPLFLKNRTLTVTCSSADMATKIRENQKKIVSKINDKLGEKQVDRIRYLA